MKCVVEKYKIVPQYITKYSALCSLDGNILVERPLPASQIYQLSRP